MENPEPLHFELWSRSFLPIALFEKLLDNNLKKAGFIFKFEDNKNPEARLRKHAIAIISIKIFNTFYKEIIEERRLNVLYKILKEDLEPVWKLFSSSDDTKTKMLEGMRYYKFEVLYIASDNIPFHFQIPLGWPENVENIAWNELIKWILDYESGDENIRNLIKSVLTERDQMRYLSFVENKHWLVQHPINDVTQRLSKEYFDVRKDKRIAKPDIMINEESFNEYFRWDQQWTLNMEGLRLIMGRPNDVALYLNISDKNVALARSFFDKAILLRKDKFYNQILDNESTSLFYDYFEHIISAIIFSYTAIETLANICIVDNYQYIKSKDGITTIHSKKAIERKFSMKDKLKLVLVEILKTPDPTKEPWWQNFINLEEIRDKCIHAKQGDSEDKYSLLLSNKIFEVIAISKVIVAYYGGYIDDHLKRILIDFPYGFGHDNVLPFFLTNENYWEHWRNMRGISHPELK